MRLISGTLLVAMLMAVACVEPSPVPGPEPVPQPVPGPEPEPEPEPEMVIDVPLHGAFTEGFSAKDDTLFRYRYNPDGDDFRYYPGFPSLSERKTDILLLRVDPASSEGIDNGAQAGSSLWTWYGSYSVRLRLPDIRKAQSTAGVVVDFSTCDINADYGHSEIGFEWLLADPCSFTLKKVSGPEPGADTTMKRIVAADLPFNGFDASAKFHIYGFDWYPDRIDWWVADPSSGEKSVIMSLDGEPGKGIPVFPSRLRINYYHSKHKPVTGRPSTTAVPRYPYELEIDSISYEPFEEYFTDSQ